MRLLPKWLYVVLAVGSYLGLHQVTKLFTDVEGIARIGLQAAHWGQYIVPGLLVLASLFLGRGDDERRRSAHRTRPSRSAHNQHVSLIKVDPFRAMSKDEFHRLLTQFFLRNGFTIESTPSELGDAVDLMLSKNSKSFVAQYRHWREHRVDVPKVREQYTVMQAVKAHGVYVITTGEFSYKAIQFAEDKNISLIDGLKLRRLVKKNSSTAGFEDRQDQSPLCPLCAAEMLIRTVTDGEGRDKRFWSCSNYPKCLGTAEIVKKRPDTSS
ncbi:MAG: restriction endonuclease [Desulfofustis sp.]|nr:restriction endonuclease [Desulfofustis sp.]